MDTQQQETQELWTDERIKATVHWHLSYNIGGITCLSETSAMALMREVRDDYQQRLDAVIAERDSWQMRHVNAMAAHSAKDNQIARLAAERDALYREVARYVAEEIDHEETLNPLVRQNAARMRYKVLTGHDYEGGEAWNEQTGVDAIRAQLAAAQARIAELEAGQAQLEGVVRLAYRKHHLEDDSIGWDELSDALKDALCEVWGDELYLTWLKANSPANMRRKGGDDAE